MVGCNPQQLSRLMSNSDGSDGRESLAWVRHHSDPMFSFVYRLHKTRQPIRSAVPRQGTTGRHLYGRSALSCANSHDACQYEVVSELRKPVGWVIPFQSLARFIDTALP